MKALWEIVLQAHNAKVAKRAAQQLQRVYSKMSPDILEDLPQIKKDVLQITFTNIRTGLKKYQ
jgi:hypothetical protein